MDDYLAKPLDPAALAEVLRRWVSRGGPTTDSGPRASNDLGAMVADLRRDLGPVAFELVCDAFVRGIPDLLSELDRAVAVGDNTAALHLAHRLKANAASFGAVRLDELTAQLEQELIAGEGDPVLRLVSLHEELSRIRATVGRRPAGTRSSRNVPALR